MKASSTAEGEDVACCSYLRSLVELMGLVRGVFAYSNEKIHERLASCTASAVLGEINNQYWPVGWIEQMQ